MSRPEPKWLSQLVAAEPGLLGRFAASLPPDPWGDDPVDPWGYEYWVETAGEHQRRIVSSGWDGLEGTDDDLWVAVPAGRRR